MQGFATELLSIDFDSSTNYAWITLPDQHEIKIWDIAKDRKVTTLSFGNDGKPTAISYFPQREIAIVTTANRFFAFDSKTARPDEKLEATFPNHVLRGGFCAHTRLA